MLQGDFNGQYFSEYLVTFLQVMVMSAGWAEGRKESGTLQKQGSAVQIHRARAAANYSFFNNGVYYLPLMVAQGDKVKWIQLPKALALPAVFMTQKTFAREMQSLHFGLGNFFS